MNNDELPAHTFTPDSLALITLATTLSFRLQRSALMDHGLLWAAVYNVEGGFATCPALQSLKGEAFEDCYKKICLPFAVPLSTSQVERLLSHNSPFAYRAAFERDIPFPTTGPLTPRDLLCDLISAFGFRHMATQPLREAGMEVRKVAATLSKFGFTGDSRLRANGTMPEFRRELAARSSERAGLINSWLVTEVCVRMAARDLGIRLEPNSGDEAVTREWDQLSSQDGVITNRQHSFSDVRPWSHWAGKLLFS